MNKKHRKYLLIAFLIAITGVGTAIAVPFLNALNGSDVFKGIERTVKIKLEKIDQDPVIPLPLPPVPPDGLVKQISYRAPQFVDDPTEDTFEPMVDLIEQPNKQPEIDVITGPVDPIPEITEQPETPMFFPQESATFMNGGIDEFRIWVQKNIVYPQIAVESHISGKVLIAFCVNKRGEVVDIELLRGLDKSVDNETIRVIASSPLWKAARQGGSEVKQKFIIPVSFILN